MVPNGISYNSYVILDEKIAVMDTVDKRASDEWMENVEKVLDGKQPELPGSHPTWSRTTPPTSRPWAEKYPEMTVVASAKAVSMLPQFFTLDFLPPPARQ